MLFAIIYTALGYWAYGYVNRNKFYIYSETGGLFMHKLIMGILLGWIMIPIALLKMIFTRR